MSSPPPLLSSQTLGKTFGTQVLFEEISIAVSERERVGLIGPNGSGKSTLLRILAGLEEPDRGSVRRRRDLRCVYVAQADLFDESLSVRDTIERALEGDGESAHEHEGRISTALGRAGFHDKSAPVSSLSGGWRKRLALARGLARNPELLLLDEPTNHLDIEGVLWLEELLAKAPFAVLFVSHDRYFIDSLASRVIEINRQFPQGYFSNDGSYGDFLPAREAYIDNLRQQQSALANKVRREVAWLRQGAKARTTKSKYRTAQAGRMIQELKSYDLGERRVGLEFSSSDRRSRELVKLENVEVSAGGKQLFGDLSLTITPGTRLGVLGPNGSGKTTFVKTLLGEHKPDRGRVVQALKLKVSFFDQARRQLVPSLPLKRALCPDGDSVVFDGRSLHVASWANRFLFRGDQLDIPVAQLSGGEQARVLLAKLMLQESDILVFDEPTNDLDITTLEVLEDSFAEFPGALILVSHDRAFLENSSNLIVGLSNGQGRLFGSYEQWAAWHKDLSSASGAAPSKAASEERVKKPAQKLSYNEQRELDGIESKILKAESEVARLQEQVASPELASDPKRLQACCAELSDGQKLVDSLYARWEELEEKRKLFRSEKG